jgi:hypothetical protein
MNPASGGRGLWQLKEKIVKRLLGYTLAFALLAAPLFAAKTTTVNILDSVTVGTTQIAAGEYKVSYAGAGPAVKVTLQRSGASPIVLDAKLVTTEKGNPTVTFDTVNGVNVLRKIQLKSAAFIFEDQQAAGQ